MLPANIQALLDAIPTAEDGHVITSEYHNALRDAIRALAGGAATPGVQEITLTLAPAFLSGSTASDDAPKWNLVPGSAHNSLASSGWIAVELPDGATIKSLSVLGKRPPGAGRLTVRLQRQQVGVSTLETIAIIDKGAPVSGIPLEVATTIGTSVSQRVAPGVRFDLSEFGVLNETALVRSEVSEVIAAEFKYVITADLTGPTAGAVVTEIRAFQIKYTN